MALSQQHRSSIHQKLVPILGAEETDALLSEFPSSDLDTPATKDFVRAEIAVSRAEVQAEFGALRLELHDGLASVRADLDRGLASVRADLGSEIAAVRADLDRGLAAVRVDLGSEIYGLRTEIADRLRQQIMWIASAMAIGMGLAAGIGRL